MRRCELHTRKGGLLPASGVHSERRNELSGLGLWEDPHTLSNIHLADEAACLLRLVARGRSTGLGAGKN